MMRERKGLPVFYQRWLICLIAWMIGLLAIPAGWVEASGTNGQRPAPGYDAPYLFSDQVMNLQDFRGEPVLLYSWATWCTVCPTQTPLMEELYQEYGPQGLHLIGVNLDTAADDETLAEYLRDKGVTFPNVADEKGKFMRAFQTFGVPDSILIDQNGNIAYHWIGAFEPLADENRAIIEAVLAGETLQASPETVPIAASMVLLAFGGGILSFLSPCLLPLVPAYVAFVGGVSLQRNEAGQRLHYGRRTAFLNGLFFVAGFSLIFVALGASAGLVGDFLHNHRDWIARIGGVFLLLLGLQMLGVLSIPGLNREARFTPSQRPAGYGRAFIVGVAFAAGWSPCIGPLLAGILTLAASEGSAAYGTTLLATYAGGLAIPFLAVTLGLDRFLAHSQRINRWLPWIERVSGVLILVMSGVLLTGTLSRLLQPFV